jgi:DNA-binding beta-propeller fold protein YncE
VVDSPNNRVEEFDRNGQYLTQWGNSGSGNGQFESPIGIAVDGTGNYICVADSGNNRIEIFVNNPNLVPLSISLTGTQVVLSWNAPTFSLQAAPTAAGVYTNVTGATSPYTNAITASQEFFRLQSN